MYIGVMIDSESYGDLVFVKRETLNETKSFMEMVAFDANCGEITWEEISPTETNKVARGFTDGDDFWVVTEIFEMNEDKIYLVQWHAYQGVDFSVSEFDVWDDAYDEMKKRYNYILDNWNVNKDQCYIDSYSCCVDDDYEWHIMNIVTKGE